MLGKCLKNAQKRQIEALSPEKCLAKLVDDCLTGEKKPGISVAEHCLITGFVAEELCKSLIFNVKQILTESAPFFASIHDVGKISPDFQRMIKDSDKHLFDVVICWKMDRLKYLKIVHFKDVITSFTCNKKPLKRIV